MRKIESQNGCNEIRPNIFANIWNMISCCHISCFLQLSYSYISNTEVLNYCNWKLLSVLKYGSNIIWSTASNIIKSWRSRFAIGTLRTKAKKSTNVLVVIVWSDHHSKKTNDFYFERYTSNSYYDSADDLANDNLKKSRNMLYLFFVIRYLSFLFIKN